mmetsp:Transcript_33924/g.66208  ORF Transcript_33924/g.66208 Transcript_33924/m.66208 type:complete len:157 (-) Transcript_33924:181-651(-)
MLTKALAFATIACASAFSPAGFAMPKVRQAASGVTMMAEDSSRRQFVDGAVLAGAGIAIAAPNVADAATTKKAKNQNDDEGFVDPRTYGKRFQLAPIVTMFDERKGCSRKSIEYTGLPSGDMNDDMCVVVKLRQIPSDLGAAKLVFDAFGGKGKKA